MTNTKNDPMLPPSQVPMGTSTTDWKRPVASKCPPCGHTTSSDNTVSRPLVKLLPVLNCLMVIGLIMFGWDPRIAGRHARALHDQNLLQPNGPKYSKSHSRMCQPGVLDSNDHFSGSHAIKSGWFEIHYKCHQWHRCLTPTGQNIDPEY